MTTKKATLFFRQLFLSFCFVLLTTTLSAQQASEKFDGIKFLGNFYCHITGNLYACDIEVTQKDYKNFLTYLLHDDYEKCKIDSSLWKSKLNFPDSDILHMVKYYHVHPMFDIYPVLNIPYAGAVKYCEWLTARYKKSLRKGNVIFKLPTEQEWVLLSNTNPATNLPYNLSEGKSTDGRYLENIKSMAGDTVSLGADGGYYTVLTNSYWPNDYGLYNVIGNVAEMTDIEYVQKGGSWLDALNDCFTGKVQTYSTPDPRVGFRVVAIATFN